MLIVYCTTCGQRIADTDLSGGKARALDENNYICGSCDTPPPPVPTSAPLSRPASTAGLPTIRPSRSTTKQLARKSGAGVEAVRGLEVKARNSNTPMLAMYIAGGVAVLGALTLLLGAGSTSPKPKTIVTEESPKKIAPMPVEVRPAPVTVPVTAPELRRPATEPLPPVKNSGNEMEEMRNDLAAERLRDAKAFAYANPKDLWSYKEKLESLVSSYRSTPAGEQAAKILSNLKLPERPEAPPKTTVSTALPRGVGEWKLIIGPKQFEGLARQAREKWKVDGDAIVKVPGTDDAAQSAADFGDGEFRFQFSVNDCSHFFIKMRQGNGGFHVNLDRSQLNTMQGKTHEIIIICSGANAKATLNGAPLAIQAEGSPVSGRIQFNTKEGEFRLYSIDYRTLEK
jgi:hypothetical protein